MNFVSGGNTSKDIKGYGDKHLHLTFLLVEVLHDFQLIFTVDIIGILSRLGFGVKILS